MTRLLRIMHRCAGVLPALLLLLAAGCGRSSGVEGSVTLDGAPVEGGTILFVAGPNQPDKAHAEIHAGKFALPSGKGPPPGNYWVQIYWLKPTGKRSNNPAEYWDPKDVDQAGPKAEMIPSKYNTRTQLNAEIKSGMNTLNYDLKSK
jgi:hypothetical protein